MHYLRIPSRRTRQPLRPVGLDRSNPLTVGLCVAMVPYVGQHGFNDPVTGRITRPSSGSFVFRVYPTGVWLANGTPSAASSSLSVTGMNTTEATFFSLMQGSTTTAATSLHWLLATGANPVLTLKHGDGTNARFSAEYRNSGGSYVAFGSAAETAMTNGRLHAVVARFKSGAQTMMVDGVLSSSSGTASTTLWNSPLTLEIGVTVDKPYGPTLAWNRYLEDAEAVELCRNPWQVLEQERDGRVYFLGPAAGAGGGFQAAWARNANTIIQPGAIQ